MLCPPDSLFQALVTDQLTADLEHRIAEHLEICETCADRLNALCGSVSTPAMFDQDATCGELEDLREDLYGLLSSEVAPELAAPQKAAAVLRLLTAEPSDDVAGTGFGRFTIRRWLGGGAFGIVFLAHDERLHREVALKLPRAQALADREVRVQRSRSGWPSHPLRCRFAQP